MFYLGGIPSLNIYSTGVHSAKKPENSASLCYRRDKSIRKQHRRN